ncbi:MAG: PhoH family protein [Candidatus Neomarinimicrobiota bacterium]|nr:PhoH family protein [Candidatus Neomarinimicrobiota bacterium]
MSEKRKLFVIDTNVVLHDSTCIHQFEENDIVVPISVLEELDHFKRGNEQLHFNAREFLRQLDELSNQKSTDDSNLQDQKQGKVRVVVNHNWHPDVEAAFQEDCPDHRILNCAYKLSNNNSDRETILISKDTNMRLKARSLGITAEDYTTDKIMDLDSVYTGSRLVEDAPGAAIETLINTGQIDLTAFPSITKPKANENFIIRNGTKSALATYNAIEDKILRVEKMPAYGILPRNAEQSFALHMVTDNKVQLVTLSGKAGTGKTLIALAGALKCRSDYRKIYLARPIVPLSNRDLGFLPGDIQSKMDPYMQPLFDNLSVIRHQFRAKDKRVKKINQMLEDEKLLITPLAYIRGRSLQRSFFIVDEAQNLTPHEVKTIITRAGDGTKIVFTGDIQQIDHPYLDKRSNGLTYLTSRMKDQDMYAHITLEKGERSQLADLASELL